MMRAAVTLLLAGATCVTVLAQYGAPQTPPRDTRASAAAAPAPTGTGALGGAVIAADSSRPLRNATVVVIGAITGVVRVTATDADGRFVVNDLPADRYLAGATKLPFLGAVAGAKRPARPGTAIALANGEKNLDVVIRLPPAASISGVITDEKGQPGANVMVRVEQWQQRGGRRELVVPPGVTPQATDAEGRFRVFGLPPGEYGVSALRFGGLPSGGPGALAPRTLTDVEVDTALLGGRIAPAPAAAVTERYAPVYFPGTTRLTEAGTIVIDPGDDRRNVDIRLQMVRIARVEGIVMTSDGQPATMTSVTLSGMLMSLGTRVMPDGRFVVPNVPPGSFTVVAQTGGAQSTQFAAAKIEVEGNDLLDLQLTLRAPLDLSGELVFTGTSPPPGLANRRVPVRSLVSAGVSGDPVVSPTTATGAFQVTRLLPGRYLIGGPLFFGATPDSVIWSLQSVVVDGRDMTDLPIDVTVEQPPKNVVVTYTDRWQQVSGQLRLASGVAASDYTIVIFPADSAYWLPQSPRILTTRPGTDGAYRFGGPGPVSLPAGNYLLAAVTDIGRDERYDPAFLATLKSAATPVTLGPGGQKTQDVIIR